jgi:hypothetical protein
VISACGRRRRPPMEVKGQGRGRVEIKVGENKREGRVEDCLGKVRDKLTQYIWVIWILGVQTKGNVCLTGLPNEPSRCVCVCVDL